MKKIKSNEKRNMNKLRLGDIAEVKLSNVDKKTKNNEREVRLCNYTDVYKNWSIKNDMTDNFMVASCNDNEFEKFILRKGQVAITKDSETPDDIGVSAYIAEDFENVVLGYHLALITPYEEKLNGQFLNYYFHTKHLQKYFENNAGGSGQRCSLSMDTIKEIPIPDLSFSTQTAIARVLSSLDDKIELNNKINRELENLAKTIYEYWFVQNADEKWEKKKIGEIAETGSGGTPLSSKKEYYENGNIPWVNSSELNFGYILATKNYITEKGLNNSSVKLFPPNSILIALYGATAGKVSLLTIPATTNQAICAIMPLNQLYTYYLKFYLSNLYEYLVKISSGSARDNLSQELVRNLEITIPTTDLVEKFNKTVSPIFERIIKNKQESAQLSQLRNFLLPLLMNGQVTVGKAQEKTKTVLLKQTDNDTKFEVWKTQIGLAARGNIDEQTLRNIYEAIDEKDR